MVQPEPRKWFTVRQAHDYTGRGLARIREALADGSLVGYQGCRGGSWRIERDALDAWMRGEIAPPRTTRRTEAAS